MAILSKLFNPQFSTIRFISLRDIDSSEFGSFAGTALQFVSFVHLLLVPFSSQGFPFDPANDTNRFSPDVRTAWAFQFPTDNFGQYLAEFDQIPHLSAVYIRVDHAAQASILDPICPFLTNLNLTFPQTGRKTDEGRKMMTEVWHHLLPLLDSFRVRELRGVPSQFFPCLEQFPLLEALLWLGTGDDSLPPHVVECLEGWAKDGRCFRLMKFFSGAADERTDISRLVFPNLRCFEAIPMPKLLTEQQLASYRQLPPLSVEIPKPPRTASELCEFVSQLVVPELEELTMQFTGSSDGFVPVVKAFETIWKEQQWRRRKRLHVFVYSRWPQEECNFSVLEDWAEFDVWELNPDFRLRWVPATDD